MSFLRRKSKTDVPGDVAPLELVEKEPPVTEWEHEKLMVRATYLATVYGGIRRLVGEYSQNNGLGFEQDFDSLKEVGQENPSKASNHGKNQHLNRFRNISAYDHSRVVISELSTDYINANWVAGYKRRHAYIASQGPVPESFAHFWYMVWQSTVRCSHLLFCCRATPYRLFHTLCAQR
jgi:hypothetical protein